MRTVAPSTIMWQRRTNRLIAAAIIIVGLTMMVTNIAQCIYIGMLLIVLALVWLARMAIADRKTEPPRPPEELPASPVLFLVTPSMLPGNNFPTRPIVGDKPPSYDQIISLDGLPPDYNSIVPEELPRYEDVVPVEVTPSDVAIYIPETMGDSSIEGTTIKTTIEEPSTSGTANEEQNRAENTETPKAETVSGLRRATSLWNTFTRGINLTSSFTLPKREQSGRQRNLSSTSSGDSVLNKSQTSNSAMLRLEVQQLSGDVASPAYLNRSFDHSAEIVNTTRVNAPILDPLSNNLERNGSSSAHSLNGGSIENETN